MSQGFFDNAIRRPPLDWKDERTPLMSYPAKKKKKKKPHKAKVEIEDISDGKL
jgi:hypothetical protein